MVEQQSAPVFGRIDNIGRELVGIVSDLYARNIAPVVRAAATKRLERGLRHGRGDYEGLLDKLQGMRSTRYTLSDIRRGYTEEKIMANGNTICLGTEKVPVEAPADPYWVGRYMQKGYDLIACSTHTGDVGTALDGMAIFRWLGQSGRASVRRKFTQVYRRAEEVAQQYDVPMSAQDDRRMAVLPSSVHWEAQQYLASR